MCRPTNLRSVSSLEPWVESRVSSCLALIDQNWIRVFERRRHAALVMCVNMSDRLPLVTQIVNWLTVVSIESWKRRAALRPGGDIGLLVTAARLRYRIERTSLRSSAHAHCNAVGTIPLREISERQQLVANDRFDGVAVTRTKGIP